MRRSIEEAEKQRLATEKERQASVMAEAEAKRKSEEAKQRVAALRTEEEERKRAEAEAQARYTALIGQGNADSIAGDYNKATADFNEAIRLDSKSTLAFIGWGDAYTNRGNHDRALADYNEGHLALPYHTGSLLRDARIRSLSASTAFGETARAQVRFISIDVSIDQVLREPCQSL